jgi:hypothetical protein
MSTKPPAGTSLNTASPFYASIFAAYPMNEGSGTFTDDWTSNSNTLLLDSSVTWGVDGASNAILNCAGVDTTTNKALGMLSPITLSGSSSWTQAFRFHQTSSGQSVVIGDAGSTNDVIFAIGGTALYFRSNNTTNNVYTGATVFTADKDYVLSYDQPNGQMHLYVDGVEATGSPIAVSAAINATVSYDELGSGYFSAGVNLFSLIGSFTYYWIWSGRVLSGAEAATLHTDPYTMFRASGGGLFRQSQMNGLGAGGPFFASPLS